MPIVPRHEKVNTLGTRWTQRGQQLHHAATACEGAARRVFCTTGCGFFRPVVPISTAVMAMATAMSPLEAGTSLLGLGCPTAAAPVVGAPAPPLPKVAGLNVLPSRVVAVAGAAGVADGAGGADEGDVADKADVAGVVDISAVAVWAPELFLATTACLDVPPS